MDLLVIVPTFGRPQNAERLLEAFERTTRAETEVVFVVDAEDPLGPSYPTPHLTTETRGMIPALNAAAKHFANSSEPPFALGFMGDDHLPVTEGWDEHYLTALRAMGTGFVYGNDLLQGARIPTQVAMTTDIVRTLGWMAPPTFRHLFVDDAWLALGNAIQRVKYLPDTIVEHLHPLAGKAEEDENYARVNDAEVARYDQLEFHRWQEQDLRGLADELRALL